MKRRNFVAFSGSALLGSSASLHAQSTTTHRVGFLATYSRANADSFLSLLRPQLEQLGWIDGRNLVLLTPRAVGSDSAPQASAISELVAERPDLILVQGVPATRALIQATKSIPIVMVGVGNPVELGIVTSFAKPGGNVTGLSYLANEYSGKVLQFLKEAAPQLRSVAVFVNPTNEHAAQYFKKMSADAEGLGMRAHRIDITPASDLEAAFATVRSASMESLFIAPEPVIQSKRNAIGAFAQTHRLPLATVGVSSVLPAGGLLAYGPGRNEYARLAARYVDRILKGVKPGDLSIEQPTGFELVINLKTAEALGLTIPQTLLLRATELIQ